MCVQKQLKSAVWIDETYPSSVQEGPVRAGEALFLVRKGGLDEH